MIELEGVRKTYDGKAAVQGLDLVIPRGQVFAFLGPNGAGKTTTIKMMVGLLRPTAGRVRICGIDMVADSRAARAKLAYVPDQPYLYDKLTGREFLRFVAGMFGMSRPDTEARIEELTGTFGLADFLDQLTENYSHGMRQRVVFASALLHRPEVLIVDEPMVGLDPHSSRVVMNLLREEAARGTTVFMSTHSLSVAERTADRIGIIRGGELIALGTMDDLRGLTDRRTDLEDIFLALTSATPDAEPRNGATGEAES